MLRCELTIVQNSSGVIERHPICAVNMNFDPDAEQGGNSVLRDGKYVLPEQTIKQCTIPLYSP